MTTQQTPPEIPPGPADAELPRRALARLGLSAEARRLAETATSLVPAEQDLNSRSAAEAVRLAHQAVEQARDVLTRAVVGAREHGVSWETLGDELGGVTKQSAQERYAEPVAEWTAALDAPFGANGRFVGTNLPEGLDQPEQTAARLDGWCAQHVAAAGDHAVTAGLPSHSATTRIHTALRYGQSLQARQRRGEQVTHGEWTCYEDLKSAARNAAEDENLPLHPPDM